MPPPRRTPTDRGAVTIEISGLEQLDLADHPNASLELRTSAECDSQAVGFPLFEAQQHAVANLAGCVVFASIVSDGELLTALPFQRAPEEGALKLEFPAARLGRLPFEWHAGDDGYTITDVDADVANELHVGDVIVSVNGHWIEPTDTPRYDLQARQALDTLAYTPEGTALSLELRRAGQGLFTVTVHAIPLGNAAHRSETSEVIVLPVP